MHNILTKGLPASVRVGPLDVPINTDFRTCMRFESMMWDENVPEALKVPLALVLFFGDEQVPADVESAYRAILWFFGGGDEDAGRGKVSRKKNKRVIDYEADAKYIYAAFLDQYGIDLQEEDIHWWKFRSLFTGLREDHRISRIMWYRSVKITSRMDKERRKHIMEMKRQYGLNPLRRGSIIAKAGAAFG